MDEITNVVADPGAEAGAEGEAEAGH